MFKLAYDKQFTRMEFFKIPKDRINHMVAVAEYMVDHCDEYNISNKNDMYFLGYIHDIGSMFGVNDHEINGANYLQQLQLADWMTDAIRYHGKSISEYTKTHKCHEMDIPSYMVLLWEADLHVGPDGRHMTMQERINDIIERHRNIANDVERDVHVPIAVNDDGMVIDIGYHLTYGSVAKEVASFINEYRLYHHMCEII